MLSAQIHHAMQVSEKKKKKIYCSMMRKEGGFLKYRPVIFMFTSVSPWFEFMYLNSERTVSVAVSDVLCARQQLF